jgi:carnitine-CoA ligase
MSQILLVLRGSKIPAISASAAIGVMSEIGEQDNLLYVQFKDSPVEWESLQSWAVTRLASFQLPRYNRVVERFELTPSKRIKKHLLPCDISDAWDRTRKAHIIANRESFICMR